MNMERHNLYVLILIHIKESPSSFVGHTVPKTESQRLSNLHFIGWIYVLDSSEKQKTSKPVKLKVCAIQI